MKRTVLNLSKDEIKKLKEIITPDDPRLVNLFPRLSGFSLFHGMNTDLQANRDEVEAILDILPAPGSGESVIDGIRTKLTKSIEEMGG